MAWSGNCLKCNKFFTRLGNHVRKFCSYDCYWKSKVKRVRKNCALCGSTFEIKPFLIKKRVFCSRSCSGKVNTKKADRKKAGLKISKSMKGIVPKNINLLMSKGEKYRFKKGQFSGEKHPIR